MIGYLKISLTSKNLNSFLTFLTIKVRTMLIEIKSATITEKGQIAIPKDVREIEGFKEGNKIAILAFDDHIELRPMKQFSEKMYTALMSEKSLAKLWSTKEEDEAWKHL